jgi:hypothetical protein
MSRPSGPYSPPAWQPPPVPPSPRRHRGRTVVLSILATLVGLALIGGIASALSGGSKPTSGHPAASSPAASAPATHATSAPPPAPAPSPAGKITGSCDVSLSASLYGQDYLTASVNVMNTGNIGTFVRVRVSWPLQGFAPMTMTRTVKVATGGTYQAEFHTPVNTTQVSQFQDEQLASSTADPCSYNATITRTFGQPTG